MSLFANFTTISLSTTKKVANSATPAGKMLKSINEQIDMLNGKTVLNQNKSPKKSWFSTVEHQGRQIDVFTPRIANSTFITSPPIAQSKEEKLAILEAFKNWEDDPQIKKAVLERYQEAKETAAKRMKNK